MQPKAKAAIARALRVFTFTCAGVALLANAVYWLFPHVLIQGAGLAYALTAAVSEPCTRAAAVDGLRAKAHLLELDRSCIARARLLESDGTFARWETPEGRFWIVAGEEKALCTMQAQQLAGYYGEIPRGGVVLDVGAHVGLFARTALRGGAQTVVAIEPAPENVECLRRNFPEEIRSGRLIVYPKGAWNREGTLRMHRVKGNSGGNSFVQVYGPGDDIELPLTTIDAMVSELRLPRVDMVKIDIKGAERQGLQGAQQTIRRWRPRLAVAAEHVDGDNVEIPRIVRSIAPTYTVSCGACFRSEAGVQPELLLFR